MSYRVVQVGTGHVGKHALRAVIDRPELELVGVVAHSPDKVGKDAGELCGRPPVGVTATAGVESVLGRGADVCLYLPTTNNRMRDVNAELCQLLAAGVNVVTTAVGVMINPRSLRPDILQRLEQACQQGGATCYATGIDPGMLTDFLPAALTGGSERVDSIEITEITTYSEYHHTDQVLFDFMGFGGPLEAVPAFVAPAGLRLTWGGVLSMLAETLGFPPLDDVTTTHEFFPAPDAFEFQGRRVEAGTVEALRLEVAGLVGGVRRVSVSHVTRLRPESAPGWPTAQRSGTYRFVVSGSPKLTCELVYEGEDGDATTGGLAFTAMRAVNAIEAVCGARPGVLSAFDLPPMYGPAAVKLPARA